MIKVIPIVVFALIAIVLITDKLLVPLYKRISKRIKTTKDEINKIK